MCSCVVYNCYYTFQKDAGTSFHSDGDCEDEINAGSSVSSSASLVAGSNRAVKKARLEPSRASASAKSKKKKKSSSRAASRRSKHAENNLSSRIQIKTECSEEEDDPQPVASFHMIVPERTDDFEIDSSLLKLEPEDPDDSEDPLQIDDNEIHEVVDNFVPLSIKDCETLPRFSESDNDQTALKTIRLKEPLTAIVNTENIRRNNEIILTEKDVRKGEWRYNDGDDKNGNENVEDEDKSFLLGLLHPMKELTISQKNEFKMIVLGALENLRAQRTFITTNANGKLNSLNVSDVSTAVPLNYSCSPFKIPIANPEIMTTNIKPENLSPTRSISDVDTSEEFRPVSLDVPYSSLHSMTDDKMTLNNRINKHDETQANESDNVVISTKSEENTEVFIESKTSLSIGNISNEETYRKKDSSRSGTFSTEPLVSEIKLEDIKLEPV